MPTAKIGKKGLSMGINQQYSLHCLRHKPDYECISTLLTHTLKLYRSNKHQNQTYEQCLTHGKDITDEHFTALNA